MGYMRMHCMGAFLLALHHVCALTYISALEQIKAIETPLPGWRGEVVPVVLLASPKDGIRWCD